MRILHVHDFFGLFVFVLRIHKHLQERIDAIRSTNNGFTDGSVAKNYYNQMNRG